MNGTILLILHYYLITNMKKKIYVVADLHYGHKNIVSGVSRWDNKDATRDFESAKEMNKALLLSINETVGPYDTLIIVGDLSFVHERETMEFLNNIKCKNLEMILGNHDQIIIKDKPVMFKPTEDQSLIREMFGIPVIKETEFKFSNIFKKIHDSRLELTHEGQRFVIDHYPLEVWNHSMRGAIMCHGHVHGGLDHSDLNMYYKRIDVRWDLLRRPILLDEIIEMMKDRKNLEM